MITRSQENSEKCSNGKNFAEFFLKIFDFEKKSPQVTKLKNKKASILKSK